MPKEIPGETLIGSNQKYVNFTYKPENRNDIFRYSL